MRSHHFQFRRRNGTYRRLWRGSPHAGVTALAAALSALVLAGSSLADPCEVVDDGTGTVSLPPAGCEYLSPAEVHEIIDGLPVGTEIQLAPIHLDFICEGNPGHCGQPGGTLGGEAEFFSSNLALTVTGTGDLSTFSRQLVVPVFCETNTGPRNPGDPVQDFDTQMNFLQGELFGDPDFCTLRITGGNQLGLPSPGHTTLTRLGPPGSSFQVDSFFDIEYRIEFAGCPGSVLDGFGGVTQRTIRMEANGPAACAPTADGLACEPGTCPDPAVEECQPSCVNYNAATGGVTVTSCDCSGPNECHVDITGPSGGARGTDNPCVVPDDTTGTITLPPAGCEYLSPEEVHEILDGLGGGATIEFAAIHKEFMCHGGNPPGLCTVPLPAGTCEDNGGSLGGNIDCFQSVLEMEVNGTGTLGGFSRLITLPAECEVHTAPRNPGDAVQTFDTDMFRLQGELFGDPDFCMFRVTGGTDFGLPSPGHTTLTRQGAPGSPFAVDSFFDITYRIEYQGCPGSALDGMGGSTTATIRMQAGSKPSCVGVCAAGEVCVQTETMQADGSIDLCCTCEPEQVDCAPTADGSACQATSCPDPTTEICQASCMTVDPVTGVTTVTDCNCMGVDECHLDLGLAGGGLRDSDNPCVVPDDAGGTVTLPPMGCEYLSPEEVHEIIDNNSGVTFELAPIHKDFICNRSDGFPGCPPPNVCEDTGGDLGGNVDCFESNLQVDVSSSSLPGYSRALSVPVLCQVHTGPRTPGDPIQDFDTKMHLLQGELFGDPDFCLLRITGGDGFSMPSPGHTTLTRLPSGDFAVDSFFDITYRIEFQGCPGSPLDGMAGDTTATIRMKTGSVPECIGMCPAGETCRKTKVVNADGTIDVCCICEPLPTGACCLQDHTCIVTTGMDCAALGGTYQGDGTSCQGDVACCLPDGTCLFIDELCCDEAGGMSQGAGTNCTPNLCPQPACDPTADGLACEPTTCPDPATEECQASCVNYNAATGAVTVTDCNCIGLNECHVDITGTGARSSDNPCTVPDNTTGTITLPPAGCEYLSPEEVHEILDGLGGGATIEFGAIHKEFICGPGVQRPSICSPAIPPDLCEGSGGSLGGNADCFHSVLEMEVNGTGTLSGFNRFIVMPAECEVHTGPRTPGDAVQDFDTDMFRLQGELFGDPDFCTFQVTGGTDFGLPSPGHTTLTRQGPPGSSFAVDSFFDITYRIDYAGCPGSALEGMSGSTTATIRMETGTKPNCVGVCPAGEVCVHTETDPGDGTIDICCTCEPEATGACCLQDHTCLVTTQAACAAQGGTYQGDGSVCLGNVACCLPDGTCLFIDELCCDEAGGMSQGAGTSCTPNLCPQPECEPTADGSGCTQDTCFDPATEVCQASCMNVDPLTGVTTVTDCNCIGPDDCHLDLGPAGGGLRDSDNPCVVSETGGTVTLPPMGCEYLSPEEVHEIIDNNSGVTFELAPIHKDFICNRGDGFPGCPPPNVCEDTGGDLGGNVDCFESILEVDVSSSSLPTYTRTLQVPVLCQVHTGPRNPGDAVQDFDTKMHFLQGELFGDPDFCLLRITGGDGFSMPSPGHTTLTQLPSGDFAVDSFFDITYRIEFQGCPGSPLDGLSGDTTATIHMQTGSVPQCVGGCPPAHSCRQTRSVNADGTIDVCCECRPNIIIVKPFPIPGPPCTTAGDCVDAGPAWARSECVEGICYVTRQRALGLDPTTNQGRVPVAYRVQVLSTPDYSPDPTGKTWWIGAPVCFDKDGEECPDDPACTVGVDCFCGSLTEKVLVIPADCQGEDYHGWVAPLATCSGGSRDGKWCVSSNSECPGGACVPITAPVTRSWTEVPMFVNGCGILPGVQYEVRASIDSGTSFSAPLIINTTPNPAGPSQSWGDVTGGPEPPIPPPVGNWTPPDGATNFTDIQGALRTFQRNLVDTGAPPRANVDLEINRVVNLADIQFLIKAFEGEDYVNLPDLPQIGVHPFDCPD